jgi:hypothetical protein
MSDRGKPYRYQLTDVWASDCFELGVGDMDLQ